MPGEYILHPAFLFSLVVLLVNDHYLKEKYSNVITGKVSDIVGLIFFPLFIISVAEIICSLVKRENKFLSNKIAFNIHLLIGITFILIKTFPTAALLYSKILSVLMWLPSVLSLNKPEITQRIVRADMTDLIALVGLIISWKIFKQASSHRPKQQVQAKTQH